MMRCGGSRLADLRCLTMFLGIAGTGGASGAGDTAPARLGGLPPGEGDRKVRSAMDELLVCLTMPFRGPVMMVPLPVDDCEPLLTMRLVWRDATGSGEVV